MNRKEYKQSMSGIHPSDEMIERIMDMTYDTNVNRSKRIRPARAIAIAAIAVIAISTVSVGAASHFVPDNAINQLIELNGKVNYNTLGTNVDATASSAGLDFHISQVLCDNNIMHLAVECPQYKGRYVQPLVESEEGDDHLRITINGKDTHTGLTAFNGASDIRNIDGKKEENMLYLTFTGISNIRNNSDIVISFDKLQYFDPKDDAVEPCDIDGDWQFRFSIDRSNTRHKLPSTKFTLDNGESYRVRNFIISPLGFSFDYDLTQNDPAHHGSKLFSQNFASQLNGGKTVEIRMTDGTVYDNSYQNFHMDTTCEYATEDDGSREYGEYMAVFNIAIDTDNIQSITIMDNVVYQK